MSSINSNKGFSINTEISSDGIEKFENIEGLFLYAEKYHEDHLKEAKEYGKAENCMKRAEKRGDGSTVSTFYEFFYDKVAPSRSATCLIYMPDFGDKLHYGDVNILRGKIIIEVDFSHK